MSDLETLENRLDAALWKLMDGAEAQGSDLSKKIGELNKKLRALEEDLTLAKEELDKERDAHESLKGTYQELSEDFGALELKMMAMGGDAASDTDYTTPKPEKTPDVEIEKLKAARAQDLAELDDILTQLKPLVEGN